MFQQPINPQPTDLARLIEAWDEAPKHIDSWPINEAECKEFYPLIYENYWSLI